MSITLKQMNLCLKLVSEAQNRKTLTAPEIDCTTNSTLKLIQYILDNKIHKSGAKLSTINISNKEASNLIKGLLEERKKHVVPMSSLTITARQMDILEYYSSYYDGDCGDFNQKYGDKLDKLQPTLHSAALGKQTMQWASDAIGLFIKAKKAAPSYEDFETKTRENLDQYSTRDDDDDDIEGAPF